MTELTFREVEELIQKLGGEQGVRKFLAEETIVASTTPITRNANGHYVITITGLALTGAEEVARLQSAGFRVDDYARQTLINDDYDKNHRLEAGKQYQIVFVPGKEVTSKRTTANLKAYAKKFGYLPLRAGASPRIRETISDKQMEDMKVWSIVSLHDPIKDSDGSPSVLDSSRSDDGLWFGVSWDHPEYSWRDDGAFAFLVPQVSA